LTRQKGTQPWGHAATAAIFLPAALALILIGCHSQPPLTPQQALGQHLYAGRCAHCHEENDLALKPPPPNIHGAMSKAHLPSSAPATDAEVRRLVLTGKGKMPSFSGRFTEEQMAALLAYLHTDMPQPQP
jgi:mono/diheme cytochrome c family protein